MITPLIDEEYAWSLATALSAHSGDVLAAQYVVRLYTGQRDAARGDAWRSLSTTLLAAPSHCTGCRLILPPKSARVLGAGPTRASLDALLRSGWHVRHCPPGSPLHAKTVCVGRGSTWLGSHNLTRASLTRTTEHSVHIDGEAACYRIWSALERAWRAGITS